jgi:hypothetical protein
LLSSEKSNIYLLNSSNMKQTTPGRKSLCVKIEFIVDEQ